MRISSGGQLNTTLCRSLSGASGRARLGFGLSAFAVLLCSVATSAIASPTVTGNFVSWPDDGWYELQTAGTYETLCEGGRGCEVDPGIYTVINHHTAERFTNVIVTSAHDASSNPAPTTNIASVASTGATSSQRDGDDAFFSAGVTADGERFTDNGDGSFRDNLTGLVWMGLRDCIVRHTWPNAIDYARALEANSGPCPSLNDGSVVGDWRLPNIKELQSLVDFANNTPALASGIPYSGNNFADFPWDQYWSSTTFAIRPDFNAWALNTGFGQTAIQEITSQHYAWPVRVNP